MGLGKNRFIRGIYVTGSVKCVPFCADGIDAPRKNHYLKLRTGSGAVSYISLSNGMAYEVKQVKNATRFSETDARECANKWNEKYGSVCRAAVFSCTE